jgi:hypothetical protein
LTLSSNQIKNKKVWYNEILYWRICDNR